MEEVSAKHMDGHTTDQLEGVVTAEQCHGYKRTAVKYITERVDVRMGSSVVSF